MRGGIPNVNCIKAVKSQRSKSHTNQKGEKKKKKRGERGGPSNNPSSPLLTSAYLTVLCRAYIRHIFAMQVFPNLFLSHALCVDMWLFGLLRPVGHLRAGETLFLAARGRLVPIHELHVACGLFQRRFNADNIGPKSFCTNTSRVRNSSQEGLVDSFSPVRRNQ